MDWPEWAWLEPRLGTRRPPVEYIDLTDCGNVTDAGLCALLHTCPSLQYLYLRRCTLVTGNMALISITPNTITKHGYERTIQHIKYGDKCERELRPEGSDAQIISKSAELFFSNKLHYPILEV